MAGKAVGMGSASGTAAEQEEEMAGMAGQSHNGTTHLHRGKTGNRLSVRDIWSISRKNANQQQQLELRAR